MLMTRRILFIASLIVIAASSALSAHESWIEARSLRRGGKNLLVVKIGNGHHFPRSEMAVAPRLVRNVTVTDSSGKKYAVTLKPRGKYLEGSVSGLAEGTCLVQATLKNPPRFFLSAVVTIGGKGTSSSLETGELFEIRPLADPSRVKKGGKLKLRVLYMGKPLSTDIHVSINGKGNFSAFTDSRGEFNLRLITGGKYLVTVTSAGRGASLVLLLP